MKVCTYNVLIKLNIVHLYRGRQLLLYGAMFRLFYPLAFKDQLKNLSGRIKWQNKIYSHNRELQTNIAKSIIIYSKWYVEMRVSIKIRKAGKSPRFVDFSAPRGELPYSAIFRQSCFWKYTKMARREKVYYIPNQDRTVFYDILAWNFLWCGSNAPACMSQFAM